AVQQDAIHVGGELLEPGDELLTRAGPERLPDLDAQFAPQPARKLRLLIAVKLHDVETHRVDRRGDCVEVRVHEDAAAPPLEPLEDAGYVFGLHPSRAPVREYDAAERRPSALRRARILRAGETADLDGRHHAAACLT